MKMRLALACFGALACRQEPASGTYVGNPTLTARYVDNPDQVGVGGELVSLETAFEPCSAPTVSAGPQTFSFQGTEARVSLELPDGPLCGILIVVKSLTIEVDDAGLRKAVTGMDFDLLVPGESIPAGSEALELVLGDDAWLPGFLSLVPAGDTLITPDSPQALRDAFFGGLDQGSTFSAINVVSP